MSSCYCYCRMILMSYEDEITIIMIKVATMMMMMRTIMIRIVTKILVIHLRQLIISYPLPLPLPLQIFQGDCDIEGELREMYVQWPFFREMIDLIAMTLSKTDISISTNYEKQVGGITRMMNDEFQNNNLFTLSQCDVLYSHSLSLCPSHSFALCDNLPYSYPFYSYFISLSLSLPLSLCHQLCEPSNKELAAVGVELRKRLVNTRANVMKVTRSEDFSNGFQLLKVLYLLFYWVKSPRSPSGVPPLGISLKGTLVY